MKWKNIIVYIMGGLLALHLFALLILKDFDFKIFRKFYASIGKAAVIIIPVFVVLIFVFSFVKPPPKKRE